MTVRNAELATAETIEAIRKGQAAFEAGEPYEVAARAGGDHLRGWIAGAYECRRVCIAHRGTLERVGAIRRTLLLARAAINLLQPVKIRPAQRDARDEAVRAIEIELGHMAADEAQAEALRRRREADKAGA